MIGFTTQMRPGRATLLLYGILLCSAGLTAYLAGTLFGVPRLLLGNPPALLRINEWIV